MNKETIDHLYNLNYMQDLMRNAYSDAIEAYEVIEKYDDESIKYNVALNYLVLSNQSYIELKRHIHNNKLEHSDIEVFFKAYDHYKHQLKEVVTDKDTNISWLHSAYNNLTDKWKEANEFITNMLKMN